MVLLWRTVRQVFFFFINIMYLVLALPLLGFIPKAKKCSQKSFMQEFYSSFSFTTYQYSPNIINTVIGKQIVVDSSYGLLSIRKNKILRYIAM
jgi:hypothetical protein